MKKRRTFAIAGVTLTLSLCLLCAADRAREQKYQQAVDLLESKGDVKGAMRLFEDVSKSPDRNLAARSLLYLGSCYEKLGQDGAQKAIVCPPYSTLCRAVAGSTSIRHTGSSRSRPLLSALSTS